ncbi:MAG: hypothetical protein F6K25_16050 [Okeania sp. SIO2G4]|uniref:hypothetical protein n=1 Tax=unclassified Okeania TaxID=2634635 RepID=UPI0013B6CC2F|nr:MULTISPECIES: hypothetical protein [unclassified Okeania]NEP07377.1 hypothetical protein [Okeania sp. SIO4D6]NEP38142.1 hypothetical protein [Okeania sp. SIO2H7]NEP73706.1 hypothetical protein [Okeania sp. SIO2G5]NEP97015.1 hypothetical protein [Okeania sp. SIO2F5]NEQ92128.1 hypothetical protein [Okeania sp. SIO2G4]
MVSVNEESGVRSQESGVRSQESPVGCVSGSVTHQHPTSIVSSVGWVKRSRNPTITETCEINLLGLS